MRRWTALCCVTLTLAACFKDNPVPDIRRTTFAPELKVQLDSMEQAPGGVYYRELEVGRGDSVRDGQRVAIHYKGQLPNGTQFDANTAPAPPYEFRLGVGDVIPGFDLGIMGMRPGGRRQIIIPPAMGYGAQVMGPIPAYSILVFEIELVAIR